MSRRPVAIDVGDIDGDEDLDVAVADFGSIDIALLIGDGQGGFAPGPFLEAGYGPQGIALGDLEVPDELWTQAPNTTPGPPLVTLVEERPGGDARTLELAPGDQLEVAPGSRVEVSASFDPERDLQEYWLLGQEYGLLEDLSATWYLVSEDPPEVELSYEPLLYSARWTAPAAGAPPLVLVLHALDTRFSEAVTWIRVGVADG